MPPAPDAYFIQMVTNAIMCNLIQEIGLYEKGILGPTMVWTRGL